MLTFALLSLALPAAWAGTPEAPEIVDPVGDCAFAPGNHYMDIVAVWISDETPTDFNVNIAIAEWTQPLTEGTGFAAQFAHQGVTFGVLAGHFGGSWSYGNGRYSDTQVEAWNDTTGSFQAAPPVVTVKFAKSNFPHDDPTDNALVSFEAASVDLKPGVPGFFLPAPLPVAPGWIACDDAASDATYVFQHGGHSRAPAQGDEPLEADAEAAQPPEDAVPAAVEAAQPEARVPAPGLLWLGLGATFAALLARVRSLR